MTNRIGGCVALLAAATCVAPLARAQSADPVTLYGRVHIQVESVQDSDGFSFGLRHVF